jgi:hypothetical protein
MHLITRADCSIIILLAAVGRFKRVAGGEHLTWLTIGGYVVTALLVVGVFVAHRKRQRRAAKLTQLDSGGLPSEWKEN